MIDDIQWGNPVSSLTSGYELRLVSVGLPLETKFLSVIFIIWFKNSSMFFPCNITSTK